MTIGKKLTLGISLISVALVVLAIIFGVVAVKIFEATDRIKELPELQAKFGTLTVQHHQWAEALISETVFLKVPFSKALDPTKCDLGKWYYSYTPPEYLKEDFEKLEEPHKRLHASGAKFIEAINSGDVELAKKIYNEETIQNLKVVRELLTRMRLATKAQVDNNLNNII
ncbi:MAG: CZB domain-containing protein [Candidatus Kapaibacteriota bacterium]